MSSIMGGIHFIELITINFNKKAMCVLSRRTHILQTNYKLLT